MGETGTDRTEQVVAEIYGAESREECLTKVQQIFDIYGVGHACLHSEINSAHPAKGLWRSLPDDVSVACTHVSETGKHPALKLSRTRHFPFDIFEFKYLFSDDEDVMTLYAALENNDIHHVYGLPIHFQDDVYVFAVGRQNESISLVELLTLQTICTNAINSYLKIEPKPCEAGKARKLSNREKEILVSVARGENNLVIAERFGLNEISIGHILDGIVERFGGCNIPHTIILAMIAGEISLSECVQD